ncbi:phosphatidylinositol glycan anchor biosynthesis class U protein [Cotesia glomerata]|uniref:phosphatidylinositol glycan anchor biosynthesis class U protein n=1 Tax=Cotesia glomerata TaxID=32391 RepID=UPI001D02CB28|nr:phosphatidylinositol glycan anchor biosynthesis class U protein [Cotesia glomerata]
MLSLKQFLYCSLAGGIRLILMNSQLQKIISDRVEISTALNSWKRVTEGVHLHNFGIDPYSGDLFHETPIGLVFFTWILRYLSFWSLRILFVVADLLTSWFLFQTARHYVKEVEKREKEETKEIKKPAEELYTPLSKNPTEELSYTPISKTATSSVFYVPAAYLFNPYIVLNCVALTTTVFTNLLTSLALCFMIKKHKFATCLIISLLALQNLYPASLIVAATIFVSKDAKTNRETVKVILTMVTLFLTILSSFIYLSYHIMGNWNFIKNTMGFILIVPDLRPNIGLYWYFFTEMFEHFRGLFIASFQINVGLLYVVPLALRLRNDPMLLSFAYLAIIAIFKSYPSLGDVGFYIALLPMWQHLFRHTQQGFIVGCFMLFCTVFAPTVWHQWIYSCSANANFYFGVTLAFAIAQIFLLTDVLFASVKRELALKSGIQNEVNGNNAKLVLE